MVFSISYKQNVEVRMVHCHRLLFPKNSIFLYLKIDIILANSADSDEMAYHAEFYLDLHCLLIYPFRGLRSSKG